MYQLYLVRISNLFFSLKKRVEHQNIRVDARLTVVGGILSMFCCHEILVTLLGY
jgi:hypothetical protein